MGLSMFLFGRKSLWGGNAPVRTEDGYKIDAIHIELGYWRKHPNLHGYIVEHFAEGVDKCQEIALDADAIEQIITAVMTKTLPTTEGFFFGVSDDTIEQVSEDRRILRGALEWLNADKSAPDEYMRSVYYCASW